MRFLTALCILGMTACGDDRPTRAAEEGPTAPTIESSITEPVWNAMGPVRTAIPEAFRGRWDATAQACQEVSDAGLKVTERNLIFWEVGVDVRAVTSVGVHAVRVQGTGHEEGETFEYSNVFQLSADESSLTVNPGPHGFARVRCLTPDFPETEGR